MSWAFDIIFSHRYLCLCLVDELSQSSIAGGRRERTRPSLTRKVLPCPTRTRVRPVLQLLATTSSSTFNTLQFAFRHQHKHISSCYHMLSNCNVTGRSKASIAVFKGFAQSSKIVKVPKAAGRNAQWRLSAAQSTAFSSFPSRYATYGIASSQLRPCIRLYMLNCCPAGHLAPNPGHVGV